MVGRMTLGAEVGETGGQLVCTLWAAASGGGGCVPGGLRTACAAVQAGSAGLVSSSGRSKLLPEVLVNTEPMRLMLPAACCMPSAAWALGSGCCSVLSCGCKLKPVGEVRLDAS